MSGDRYDVPLDDLVRTARTPVESQVEVVGDPRLPEGPPVAVLPYGDGATDGE